VVGYKASSKLEEDFVKNGGKKDKSEERGRK